MQLNIQGNSVVWRVSRILISAKKDRGITEIKFNLRFIMQRPSKSRRKTRRRDSTFSSLIDKHL